MGPAWLGLEKIVKMKVFRWLEYAVLQLAFANTVNASFNYMLFQLLYKYHVAFSSSEIT